MNDIKYTFFVGGQNPFLRVGIDTIAEEIEPLFEATDWEYSKELMKNNQSLYIDTRPTADAGTVSGVVIGVCLFVGAWVGEKLLDEFYEAKLRPRLVQLLSKILRKSNFPPGKGLEYQQLVTFEDLGLTVIIRLLLKQENEIEESLNLLLHTHKLAADWIEKNGKKAPIHCYIVENGKSNIEPLFYSSLEEIKKEEREKVLRKVIGGNKP
jgi:hypothetical protein